MELRSRYDTIEVSAIKRDTMRSNLLVTLAKSGMAMAVPAVPVAMALKNGTRRYRNMLKIAHHFSVIYHSKI